MSNENELPILIYTVEDEQHVILKVAGVVIAQRLASTAAGVALLKLNAAITAPPEPAPSSPVPVEGWQRGERELAARWATGLLAKLSTKPDHADDCLWLERLAQLFALPAAPAHGEVWE